MDATRWKIIEQLYEEVRELSDDARVTFLATYGADSDLIAQVNALFEQRDEATDFFESFQEGIFPRFKEEASAAATPLVDSLIGQQIAQYEIVAKLGSGGMGVVYRAKDKKLDRDVALKILNTDLNSNEVARERFKIEARAASSLSHPNVATVYAIEDILDDRLAIAMMYCEGDSLKDRLKNGLPNFDEVVHIAMQVANGLRAAHQKGIIHRDVKPGNIMLAEDGTVRIVDFGLARVTGQSRITRTGNTMGTVAYMAPEQAKGGEASHQADIWSFGVVLFEMLTGQVPFRGEHMHSMLYAVINDQPVPLAGMRPGIPPQLEFIVSRALNKDLRRRYGSFEDLIVDLKAVRDGKDLLNESGAGLPDDELESDENSSHEDAGKGTEMVKILVVDDEPDIELLLRQQYLKKIRAGEWKLFFAENGADALEKLEANPDIQLVLTDIQMPVMDGLTLLTRLGGINRLIRTIVVSAYGDMQNIRKAMNNGAYDFLTKPIQFADLERTIYKTIKNVQELNKVRASQNRLLNLENELALARKIQQRVLPKQLPESDKVDIYAYMEPARDVNSDFYDFFHLDDDRLGFFIGDVSGRGFSASIFMSMCRTLLKADAHRGVSPAKCMEALNEYLYPEQFEGVFITVFYGILNLRTGVVQYCNAGQNPPYVLRESGNIEKMTWEGGIGIGVKKYFDYLDEEVQLGDQDALFLYTDGLTKSKNAERALFSESQLLALLKDNVKASPSQLIRRVVRGVAEFCMGVEQADDNTMLAVKRTVGTS